MSVVRSYQPTDHPQLAAFLANQLGPSGQALLVAHLDHPRLLSGMVQLVEAGGQIHACILARLSRIQLDSALLECGLLTIIAHRLDAEVLETALSACVTALMESDATLALIQGAARTFAHMGFAAYRYSCHTILPPTTPVLRGLLRPATTDDHDDIAALYQASYRTIALAELRSPADWRSWPLTGAACVCADGRGRTVGFVLIDQQQVIEAGAADAGAARTLLAALHQETPNCILNLPTAHLVAQAALQLGGEHQIRALQPDDSGWLAGVLDLAGTMTAMLRVLERRLVSSRYDSWTGTLGIALEHQQIALAFNQGHAIVVSKPSACDVWLRRVSLSGLAQLLLGYRDAADLRATNDLVCDDTALGLVNVLFPIIV